MPLYLTVLLCAVLATLLVYRYDLYEREPWYMLLLAALLGAVTMRLVGTVELVSLRLVASAQAIAAVAALHEELARLLVVVGIALVLPSQFNDPMDGIVYGSIVGLGMGVEESFYLLNLLEERSILTLPVELVRLLGHLIMGGIAGFGVGLVRMREAQAARTLVICFCAALLLHFSWDWVALDAPVDQVMSVRQTAAAVAIMLTGMGVFGVLVITGSRRSKLHFAPQSKSSLWGWPFTKWKD